MTKIANKMTRLEHDSLGEVGVAADRYWGAQTQRSLENFPIGDERFPRAFLWALATIKMAAATANQELGRLEVPEALLGQADKIRELFKKLGEYLKNVKDRPGNYREIVRINAGGVSTTDDVAELEVGPNRCAVA